MLHLSKLGKLVAFTLYLSCALAIGSNAKAHQLAETRVWIDGQSNGWSVTLVIPLDRLEIAFGQALNGEEKEEALLSKHREALVRYILNHIGARSTEGAGKEIGWLATRPDIEIIRDRSGSELKAELRLVAPSTFSPRKATLMLDVVAHEIKTHRIQIFLRNDWKRARVGDPPLLLGEIGRGVNSLDVDLDEVPSTFGVNSSFLKIVALGAQHILLGADHLVFLLLLVVVAPLVPSANGWQGYTGPPAIYRKILKIVTAFSVAHSVTLALGSFGVIRLPSDWIEIAVGVSISIAAVHAWRPLMRVNEIQLAFGFGLVHGLAFSNAISHAGLTLMQQITSVVAFNLGIEMMQIFLVLLVLPVIIFTLHNNGNIYRTLRMATSALAFLASIFWVFGRVPAMI